MNPEIQWTGSEDDLTARVGEYEFSVAKSDDTDGWLFMVGKRRPNKVTSLRIIWLGMKDTKSSAQSACIEAFNQHVNKK